MLITVENGIFVAISTFEEKDLLKFAGFWWDSKLKRWWTNDVNKALQLKDFFDYRANNYIQQIEERKKKSLEDSSRTTSDFQVPLPSGIEFYPFQRAGVEFLTTYGNVMVGDEQRLGKMWQTLGYMNVKRPDNVLVVCPASVKAEWRSNALKLLTRPYNIEIVSKRFPLPKLTERNLFIINYDMLKKWKVDLKRNWDLIVFDESHKLKNRGWITTKVVDGKEVEFIRGTERTLIALQIAPYGKKVVLLTGTPAMNKPDEFFMQLKIASHPLGKSWKKFADEYLIQQYNGFGMETLGYKNLDEFSRKLREGFMIRRTRDQVLPQLPPKTREIIPLELDEMNLSVEVKIRLMEEKEKYESIMNGIRELDSKTARENNNEMRQMWIDRIDQLKQTKAELEAGELSHSRNILASAKVPFVIKFVDDLLEEVEQVVIFGYHLNALGKLKEHYGDRAGMLTGPETLKEREEERQEFLNKEKRVMIVSIRAGNEGISFATANVGVFVDWDWNPKVLTQAEDRLIDITQSSPKIYYYLAVDETVDSYMAKMRLEKERLVDSVVDGMSEIQNH